MRILITGATGFIGRHLVAVLEQNHKLFALYRGGIVQVGKIEWFRCDLGVPLNTELLPKAIDVVVHLAQSRRYREFPVGAEEVFSVNVASTMSLLNYATIAGAHQFILASTGSVYTPDPGPRTEEMPLEPKSFYAASKLAAEVLARPFSAHMKVCILRLFFPYGPGQKERLVSDLIGRVTEGRPVTIKGTSDGLLFNPTYISDVAMIIRQSIEEEWGGTLNVASPRTISIREAARCIGSVLGKPPIFEVVEGPEPLPVLPNLSALGRRYALESFTLFEDGLQATIDPRAT